MPTLITQAGVGIFLAVRRILIPLAFTVIPEPSKPVINRSSNGFMPVSGVGVIIRLGSLPVIKIRYFGDTKSSLSWKSLYERLSKVPSKAGSDNIV